MSGPPINTIGPLTKRLASASQELQESESRPRSSRRRTRSSAARGSSPQNAFRLRVRGGVGQQHRHRAARLVRGGRRADAVSARARRSADRDGAAGRQVITPRRIRLLRAPDLAGYRSTLVDLTRASRCLFGRRHVRARADQRGRRTTHAHARRSAARSPRRAHDRIAIAICTIALIARLPEPPRLLSGFEREAVLAAGAREARRGRRAAAVSRASGAHRRDAHALRSPPPPWPHRRRFRSPVERRARTGGRIGSRRGATARSNAIPVGGVSRLRGPAPGGQARSTSTARARSCWQRRRRRRCGT